MMLVALVLLVLLLVLVVGLALRVRWELGRARRERPATLEGGGSHLSRER